MRFALTLAGLAVDFFTSLVDKAEVTLAAVVGLALGFGNGRADLAGAGVHQTLHHLLPRRTLSYCQRSGT